MELNKKCGCCGIEQVEIGNMTIQIGDNKPFDAPTYNVQMITYWKKISASMYSQLPRV